MEPYIARYWHLTEDGKVHCDLCPRGCQIKDGHRGVCFVRVNEGNRMVLATYGRSSGFCIDPVEKKPLNHFLPGSPIFSFGTAGCNLLCKFCQNWDISKAREFDVLSDAAEPWLIAEAALQNSCRSVAFTYNDPVIFMEYAVDVAKECHQRQIKTVAVTAGYINEEPRREFFSHIDAANVDLKAFSEKFYHEVCGGALQPVLDSLVYLKKAGVWLEITTLLIPGLNDSEKEIGELSQWVLQNLGPEVPLHFSAFHPAYKMLEIEPTPFATLQRARQQAMASGLHYVYTGNVHDEAGSSTYCPGCQKKVIGRDWYVLTEYHLSDDGHCLFCGRQIAGVFDGPAGDWGAHRKPIHLEKHRSFKS